jgi:hypothetical protein
MPAADSTSAARHAEDVHEAYSFARDGIILGPSVSFVRATHENWEKTAFPRNNCQITDQLRREVPIGKPRARSKYDNALGLKVSQRGAVSLRRIKAYRPSCYREVRSIGKAMLYTHHLILRRRPISQVPHGQLTRARMVFEDLAGMWIVGDETNHGAIGFGQLIERPIGAFEIYLEENIAKTSPELDVVVRHVRHRSGETAGVIEAAT